MNVCVCEKDSDSYDMNLKVVNTGYLEEIANDDGHEDKELAQEWLDAINDVYEFFKEKNNYFGADYANPSGYLPDGVEIRHFPAEIAFCCEIYCG
jgi:hypothetical protein